MSRFNPFNKKKSMSNKENEMQEGLQNGQEEKQHDIDEAAMHFNADDSLAGSTHLNDEMASDSEDDGKSELEHQLKESQDRYLRLVAEFDNFRKRTAREKIELIKTAGEDVMKSLLEVLDDSERAMKQLETSEDVALIKEGVVLVFNKLQKTLQSKGLKAMESKDQEFDTELHEAITEIPAPTDAMKGKVIDEITKGYYLNDKIIRHAKVVVGK
jgi:molecular chaperone GrpE